MNIRGKISELRAIFRGGKFNAEMDEEMRLHLELRAEKLLAAGLSPEDARHAASKAFGGIEQLKSRARDQRKFGWVEDGIQDLHYSLRMLRRSPIFSAVAILSLSIGIGAATGVFTLVNAILLGSLPVPNPSQLRVLDWSAKETHLGLYVASADPTVPGLNASGSFSTESFKALRQAGSGLSDIFAYQYLSQTGQIDTETFRVSDVVVSGNYFSGLQVQPALGELLGPEDEKPNAPQRVVITHRFWQAHFNLNPNVLGKQLILSQHPFTIVGVLPVGFAGALPGQAADTFTGLSSFPLLATMPATPDFWWLQIMARLKPDVSSAQFRSSLQAPFAAMAKPYLTTPDLLISDGSDGPIWNRQDTRTQLELLFAMTGLVIVVACANLAGLLIARGASRRHELSLREALGADRRRLVRQLLTETFVLSLIGGGIGILVSLWTKIVISHLLSGTADELPFNTSLDGKVLGFALAATVLTTILSGVWPSLRASRTEPSNGLHGGAPKPLGGVKTGQAFVVLQIALSLLITTGAALYARTLIDLVRANPGFQIDHLLTFQMELRNGSDDQHSIALVEDIRRAINALPGVESATILSVPLLANGVTISTFAFTDRPAREKESEPQTHFLDVGETFFRTMRIPLLSGREILPSDTATSRKVMVVNEAFAKKYFPGISALGEKIRFNEQVFEIVGVCGNIKQVNIRTEIAPVVYFPFAQKQDPFVSFALRTKGPPMSLALEVRKAVRAVEPRVPVLELFTEEQLRDRTIVSERMFAKFSGALMLVVLTLSSIGLYGLVAYDVAGRTKEIGIRTALGAHRGTLIRATLKNTLLLAGAGIALGIPLTFILSRAIRAQLYEITPSDPVALVSASLLLFAVALLAAWIPIRRATQIDPMAALRCE